MSALTGDFAAIFQVSRNTINRLLASMHQETDPQRPRVPHAVRVPIDDGYGGYADVQVGVPRISPTPGSSGQFRLRVKLRAKYESPWPGEQVLEFTNGEMRADYVLDRPNESWPGWSGFDTSEYVAITLIEGSVGFTGTETSGWDPFSGIGTTTPSVLNDVAALIGHFLSTSFQATPLRAGQFGPGMLTCVAADGATTAIAGAVDVGGSGGGSIDSIQQPWLDGRDVGIALSADAVIAQVRTLLANINVQPIYVDYGLDVTYYHVTLDPPPVPQWQSSGDRATLSFSVSGKARTAVEVLPDVSFTVYQTVDVGFDPTSRSVTLSAGAHRVNVDASGLYGDFVEGAIAQGIGWELDAYIGPALRVAQRGLDQFSGGGERLAVALRKLDFRTTVRLDEGVFRDDGILLRGRVNVSDRLKPVVTFRPTADNGFFTAVDSWVPGGNILKYHWNWVWGFDPSSAGVYVGDGLGDTFQAAFKDRYLLQGPLIPGSLIGELPHPADLPGLNGPGGMIMSIEAEAVDAKTGDLVTIEVPAEWIGYGGYHFPFELRPGFHDIYWTDDIQDLLHPHDGPHPDEITVGRARVIRKATAERGAGASNTLIVTGGIGAGIVGAVEHAVAEHGRTDAGLLTVIAFGHGELSRTDVDVRTDLARLQADVSHPVLIVETVDSALSDALGLPEHSAEPSFSVISPGGGITWRYDGALSGDDLAGALANVLFPSPPPVAQAFRAAPAVGSQPWRALTNGVVGADGKRYPVPPLGKNGDAPSLVTFLDHRSTGSIEQARELGRMRASDDLDRLTVFVNGEAEHAQGLSSDLGAGTDVIPDVTGAVAAALGIRYWPTTLRLDEHGTVIESWVGVDPSRLRPASGEGSDQAADPHDGQSG